MGINSTEVAYGFGQLGSGYMDDTTQLVPPAGMVIINLMSLSNDTIFSELTPEVQHDGTSFVGTVTQVAGNGTGSQVLGQSSASKKIKLGFPLYGRWTSVTLSAGRAVAYFGK